MLKAYVMSGFMVSLEDVFTTLMSASTCERHSSDNLRGPLINNCSVIGKGDRQTLPYNPRVYF